MDRQQLVIVTAAALFAAFLVGWFASWLVHRLFATTRTDPDMLDSLARQLQDAEAARATDMARHEAHAAELMSRADAAETEAQVALDGLRESRTEVEELRDYIEKRLARNRGTQS